MFTLTKKNPSEFLVEQRAKSNEQRAKSNEQRAKSNKQRAKSNEQRARSNEQRVKSNEQLTKSNEQRAACEKFHLSFFLLKVLNNVVRNDDTISVIALLSGDNN